MNTDPRLLPLWFLAGCVATAAEPCQDQVTLADGTLLSGTLEEVREGRVTLVKADGAIVELTMDDVVELVACTDDTSDPQGAETPPETGPPEDATAPELGPATKGETAEARPAAETADAPTEPAPFVIVEDLKDPPFEKPGLHVGLELNFVGAALRLEHSTGQTGIARFGVRLGVGLGVTLYPGFSTVAGSPYAGGAGFAMLTVTFRGSGPVGLEAHAGPALWLYGLDRNYPYAAWLGGGALRLEFNRFVDARIGLTGGLLLDSSGYMVLHPEAGLVLDF